MDGPVSTCSRESTRVAKAYHRTPREEVTPSAPVRFAVMGLPEYGELRAASPECILGAILYTRTNGLPFELNENEIVSNLTPIGNQPWAEVISVEPRGSVNSPTRFRQGRLRMTYTNAHAFGHWEVGIDAGSCVRRATLRAYREILGALEEVGGIHLWRCWNVIPSIHVTVGTLDRYQQFCLGRHEALLTDEKLSPESLPAASAVGSSGTVLQVSFLGGKQPGTMVENPDQISAYAYPRQYGPASPSFSRSLLADDRLWLSGTASIAGHRSLHRDDLTGQVSETAARIRTLLANAESCHRHSLARPKDWKIFLRHADTAKALMPLLKSNFPKGDRFHLVEADICREELLIEIEGATS